MFRREEPQAYSRITRTPIYLRDYLTAPQGSEAAGLYHPDTDRMEISRKYAEPGRTTIAHESAHAIWNKSNLKGMGGLLAPEVPASKQATMSLYKYGSDPETRANEGLGFSIGDSTATPYVNDVANRITDPNLAAQLRRLHQNELGVQEPRGIGGLRVTPLSVRR